MLSRKMCCPVWISNGGRVGSYGARPEPVGSYTHNGIRRLGVPSGSGALNNWKPTSGHCARGYTNGR